MYDKKAIRRRRAALGTFIGLSLLLLTIYFGESASGGLHAIQRGAQEVLSPIEEGASRALKPARDFAGWVGDVTSAKGDNEELRGEVARLRRELARAQTNDRDSKQIAALDRLSERDGFPQGTEPVTARVIARSPTVWYSAVKVNKGSSDGIDEGQPVVTGDGLVGKVLSVTSGTAQVRLITDESSAVSAQVVPDGANGIVKPEVGNPNDLLLDFVEKRRKVREGATLVTSGFTSHRLESLFPRGIPIGKVKRSDAGELELYQRVHIDPFADLRRMDYVQILTAPERGERAALDGESP